MLCKRYGVLRKRSFICSQATFAGVLVYDNGFGVVECIKLGYPLANVFPFWVKFFCLQVGVKDAKIRCCIYATASAPLPAAIVRCQVVVYQLFGKIGFAPAPVYKQVLA